MRKKKRQLNVRISEDAGRQVDELRDWTGATQTQLVILAIDQYYRRKREESKHMQLEKRAAGRGEGGEEEG